MKWFATSTFFNIPLAVTLLLIILNTINFLLCVQAGGSTTIPVGVLVAKGALTPSAAQPGQYWHLVAYGFLYANALHLVLTVFSLVICGPFLERRLGSSTFLVVYVAALIGGGLVSLFAHAGPFTTIGASAGTFGTIGALFALWILGSKELSAPFFLMNFTVNIAFASHTANVDWAVKIGGFVAGMASIAVLSLIAKTNVYWLKCWFPEFVKLNIMLLAAVGGTYIYFYPPLIPPSLDPRVVEVAGWLISILVLIKFMDMLLAIKHGLVGLVIGFTALNGLMTYIVAGKICELFRSFCWPGPLANAVIDRAARLLCVDPDKAIDAVTAAACVLTLVVFIYPLQRGFRDVGFVGATYMAERRRQRSL